VTDSMVSKKVDELNTGLYGPRFCRNCNKIVEVKTYKLAGTDYVKCEGYKVTAGFVGSHVCTECRSPIDGTPHAQTE